MVSSYQKCKGLPKQGISFPSEGNRFPQENSRPEKQLNKLTQDPNVDTHSGALEG